MDVKKALLFSFIAIIISSGFYIFLNKSAKISTTSTKSIRGIQTQIVGFTPTPTSSSIPTLTPTPTRQPLSIKIQPTSAKQYGGWYWQPGLNRAQVWIGTDSAGKDIWVDYFPAPTPTPTHKPATQQPSSSQENTSGSFSEIETKVTVPSGNTVGTGNYLQSCSKDGSNQNIPKCP